MIQPKDFLRTDLYSCRRWRWVQHTVNEFWCHWRKEFLQSLQERKKWTNTKRNLKVGDIVILQEANTIRNDWYMCRVMETYCNEKGFVRSGRSKIGSVDQAGRNNIVDRPVSKVVLLLESEEVENVLQTPTREQHVLMHCSGVHLWKRLQGTTILRILSFTLLCFRIRTFSN